MDILTTETYSHTSTENNYDVTSVKRAAKERALHDFHRTSQPPTLIHISQ